MNTGESSCSHAKTPSALPSPLSRAYPQLRTPQPSSPALRQAWDLAFHTIALSHADLDFAKEQLELMMNEFQEYRVNYLPAESHSRMFGGNSNWRGPVWMPMNTRLIRALLQFYMYYGDNFKIECPTGSGKVMNYLKSHVKSPIGSSEYS
jgi:hypothetical protein